MIQNLSMIVAMAKDHAIGNKGDLLCYLSADLKHFKEITMGHAIIMGRKTFESLPKGALPGRLNVVISRNPDFEAPGATVVNSIEDALKVTGNQEKRFIIGGAHIYDSTISLVDKIYLTLIDHEFPDADTRLAKLNLDDWNIITEEKHSPDEKNAFPFSFMELVRK